MLKRLIYFIFSLIVGLSVVIGFMPSNDVQAGTDTYNHIIPFTITDTSGSPRTNIPVILSYDVASELVARGYANATCTNTYMDSSGAGNYPVGSGDAYDYSIADSAIPIIIPSLSANADLTLNLYTGYSPVQSSFPIIIGETGAYITIGDDDDLELGNDFDIEVSGYIDTSTGIDKDVFYKEDAIILYVSDTDELTAEMTGTALSVTATCDTGEHIIEVGADTLVFYISIDGATEGSGYDEVALDANSVADTGYDWILNMTNVMPYITYYKQTVSSALVAWYEPTGMIEEDILPDRAISEDTQDGTITWGTNEDVTITGGDIMTSNNATSIGTTSAIMQSNLTYIGTYSSVMLSFEYGLDTEYGAFSIEEEADVEQSYSIVLSSLTPNTTYHYRAIARNGDVYSYGEDKSFTTLLSSGGLGSTAPIIVIAGVFHDYYTKATDDEHDLLVVAELILTYPPYYPTETPSDYFHMQLLDIDEVTVIGASPITQWGDRPCAIYFNPTQREVITDKGAYIIKIANISSEDIDIDCSYTLTEDDWKGNGSIAFDDWCRQVATHMENTDGATLTNPYLTTITDYGVVISLYAGGYFTNGVYGITQARPNLFQSAEHKFTNPEVTDTVGYNAGTTLEERVGTNISTDTETVGDILGLDGQDILLCGIGATILAFILYTVASTGGWGSLGALCLAVPIIGASAYLNILNIAVPTIAGVIFIFFIARQFWIKTT